MMYIHRFVTEYDVNYYKSKTNDEIKEMLHLNKDSFKFIFNENNKDMFEKIDLRKLYGLPDGDIDVLLQQFREDNFTSYIRKNNWRYTHTKVLCNDGSIRSYETRVSSFKYLNKWDQESESQEYMIIIDKDNKILWIGGISDNSYFLLVDKNIYNFRYEHTEINLFPNIASDDEYFWKDNNILNDDLIRKYKKNVGVQRFCSLADANSTFKKEKIGVSISVNEYFEKGFFYKGIKWNKYYEYMYTRGITRLISIQVKDGLFYIEIENVTYPHYGYFLLDLTDFKIIKAEKI